MHADGRAAGCLGHSVLDEADRLVERECVRIGGQVDPRHRCRQVVHERAGNPAAHPVRVGEEILQLAADERREADDPPLDDGDARPAFNDVRLVDPKLVRMRFDPLAVALVRERRAAEDVANRAEIGGR